jgi:hypothetical protein
VNHFFDTLYPIDGYLDEGLHVEARHGCVLLGKSNSSFENFFFNINDDPSGGLDAKMGRDCEAEIFNRPSDAV